MKKFLFSPKRPEGLPGGTKQPLLRWVPELFQGREGGVIRLGNDAYLPHPVKNLRINGFKLLLPLYAFVVVCREKSDFISALSESNSTWVKKGENIVYVPTWTIPNFRQWQS